MKAAKKWISLLLAFVLAVSVLPLASAAKTKTKDLLLATVSDIHYYPNSLAKYKGEAFYTYLGGSNCHYDTLNGVLDSAFAALKRDAKEKGLKYVVLCGDLTTNGEYEGHVELAKKLKKLEKDTGLKVFVINGNHDINNSDAAAFVTDDGARTPARITTPAEFYKIYYKFGFDEAVSTYAKADSGKPGALSYALKVDGYRFIMIDAGRYTVESTKKERDEHETGGYVTPELLKWVQKQVAAAKKAGETPIAFTHWNLSEMNYFHGELLQGFVIDEAYKLQETFADMGIHYAFSGHQHVADIDVTYSDAGEPLYSVITPSMTQFPFAFRETAFSTDSKGKIKADFQLVECDDAKAVKSDQGETYAKPFRNSGFRLQFGNGDPTEFVMRLAKNMTYKYLNGIRKAGSIVTYLKNEFDLDLEAKIEDLINGGFSVAGNDILTTQNLMSVIQDLDTQLMLRYINDPDAHLWPALANAVDNLLKVEINKTPCTKFIKNYGFGDAEKPGTLGDLLFSVMIYMYAGNEDVSDDAFMKSVLKTVNSVAFVDKIFDAAEKYLVEDFLVDEILGNTYLHVNKLFTSGSDTSQYVSAYAQFMFRTFAGILSESVSPTNSFMDFMQKMISVASYATIDESGVSLKNLAEKVLATGKISYGSSIREVVYYFLNEYFPLQNKEAMAEQIYVLLEGMVYDEDRDYGVSYNYTGPVKVTPTAEDMQVPTDITMRVTGDTFTVHWLTKYSVTGSDIRITDKKTGKAVSKKYITSANVGTTYTGFGFNFGSFGILPYTQDINAHTVTVSGLVPGRTYEYKIGDASKGFWSDPVKFTVPADSPKEFTFLYLSDYAASNTKAADRFADLLRAGLKDYKKTAFAVLGGSSALNGADDTQFSAVVNAASDVLGKLPVFYVAGANDVSDTGTVKNHYNAPAADKHSDERLGTYYSYDYGNAHFAVLNTNDLLSDGTLSLSQVKWLRSDLKSATAKWRIAVMDAPVFTEANENDALQKQLMDLFSQLGVDLVLQNGAKAYYRTHLISGGEYQSTAKTVSRTVNGNKYKAVRTDDGFVAIAPGTSGLAYENAVEHSYRYNKTATPEQPVYTAVTVNADRITLDTYQVSASGKRTRVAGAALEKTGVKLLMGDLDNDKHITTEDARTALRYALELQTLTAEQKLAADVDGSRSIDTEDARKILRAALGLETIQPKYREVSAGDLQNVDF